VAGLHSGAYAKTIYHNVNRTYDPVNGRFLSQDDNSTGAPNLSTTAYHGEAITVSIDGFEGQSLYGDGMSLFAYVGSTPSMFTDPLGLESWDDEIDSLIFDLSAGRVAAMHHAAWTIGRVAQTTGQAILTATLASMFPPVGIYLSVRGAAEALEDGLANGWNGWNTGSLALNLVGAGAATGASYRAATSFLDNAASSVGSGYATVGNQYARMNSARSGFNAHSRPLTVLQALCFVAGTSVLMEDGTFKPIEQLQIGEDVASWPDPLAEDATPIAIDAASWRVFHMVMDDADCKAVTIALLRPMEWMAAVSARLTEDLPGAAIQMAVVGQTIELTMPEMGLEGAATVTRIEPCPNHLDGLTRGFVTGTIQRDANSVLRIYCHGIAEPIGVTATHRFWSMSDDGWTAANDLEPGDVLRTVDGCVTVACVFSITYAEAVNNLEVFFDHTYFASRSSLWVHNVCVPTLPMKNGWWRWADDGVTFRALIERQGTQLTLWEAELAGRVGTGTWKSVIDQIKSLARSQGMSELRIVGERTSGANQGARDIIIRLN